MRLLPLLTTLRSRVRRCAPWIAMLLLMPVAVAQGQTPTIEPLGERFFPPLAPSGSQRLTLTPFLSLGERYDDNIFLTPSPKASDAITIPAAGIRLRYVPSPATSLGLDYRVGGEIFAKHAEQDAVSQQGELSFASRINPYLSLTVRDAFISTTEPLQKFVRINEATGLRDISQQSRTRTTSNIAAGTVELRLTERAIVDLLFEHALENVSTPQELNETRYSIGTEVGYLTDIARRSKAYISYLATFFTFGENGTTPANARSANFQVHTVLVGWRHTFSPTLAGDAALGYAITQSGDPAADNLGSIVGRLNVTQQLRDGQVSFGYNRNFTSGGGVGGAVREDALIATFFWKATPKVTTLFASKYALFDFLGEPVVGNAGARSFLSLRPGLAYQILPLVNLAFYYTYESTDFNRPNPKVSDQKFTLISQLALRESVFLSLMYDYSVRHLQGPAFTSGLQDFARNQVMLLLTYAPTLRF